VTTIASPERSPPILIVFRTSGRFVAASATGAAGAAPGWESPARAAADEKHTPAAITAAATLFAVSTVHFFTTASAYSFAAASLQPLKVLRWREAAL
jgi:hypothetical protein